MTVADDMFPKRLSTSRETISAAGARSNARSTASTMVRPPGCTAHMSIELTDVPPSTSSA